jgi:riboflavin biosynthesis pyrimidine reductase
MTYTHAAVYHSVMNRPRALEPLQTLIDNKQGRLLPLPARLTRLYGNFRAATPRTKPLVFSNFVTTLDGVVSLQTPGHAAGGDISGFNTDDRMVMGLLRAVADVVIVGSGTLDADPRTVWTPEAICPELAAEYRLLRKTMAKQGPALNVVVTASGSIDLRSPVFASGKVSALILTTSAGAKRLTCQKKPGSVEICAVGRGAGAISPQAILREMSRRNAAARILVEGGPRLLGSFYKERLVDEQFLTLAPQIAGRDVGDKRLSLVMGKTFAPRDPLWGALTDARRSRSHLFLRYSFPAGPRSAR